MINNEISSKNNAKYNLKNKLQTFQIHHNDMR